MKTSVKDFRIPGKPSSLHGTHLTLLILKNSLLFLFLGTGSHFGLPGSRSGALIGNQDLDA
jgi:hypothetical protein